MSSRTPLVAILSALGLFGAFMSGHTLGTMQVEPHELVGTVLNKDGDVLSAPVSTSTVDFAPFWRVWNTLERKFIPFSTSSAAAVPLDDRLYSSIEGLVRSYNDPYTVFMRPQVSKDFKIATKGSLEGIGSIIGERDGRLLVVQPLEGSPAQKAGLVPGDAIVAIDGTPTEGLSVDEAVGYIRGEGGTTVTLGVVSEAGESRDVPIVRGTIEIPSTAHAVVEREVPKAPVARIDTNDDGVPDAPDPTEPVTAETETRDFYVLRLFSFSQSSMRAFERELKEYVESGAGSLIVDLRGNPGGYLDAAVSMAGWFVPKGTLVVKEYRGPEKKEVLHYTRQEPLFEQAVTPRIAILVDQGSASASEILAGALQEYEVATLVGTKTFGKGSVQELVDITDTLSLKVTVSRWYTPLGRSISAGGLLPDIVVDPAAATSGDPWLDAAIEYLSA